MMFKKFALAFAMLTLTVASVAQTDTCDADCQKKKFRTFLDSLGIDFRVPKNFHPTPVKENKDLNYRFALLKADSSIEVRYTVWSLREAIMEYDKQVKKNPKLKEQLLHPNDMYKGLIQANMRRMGGGKEWEIRPFPDDAVKEEFGANAGGSCFFVVKSPFGEGYKYGQFVYLHKDGVADVIITYLSNDKENMPELMKAPFMSLVFMDVVR